MGLVLWHRKGCGVHIEGDGQSIDVMVTNIGGSKMYRKVDLQINGISGLTKLHLSYFDENYELIEGFKLGIAKTKHHLTSKTVRIYYESDEKYKITNIFNQ